MDTVCPRNADSTKRTRSKKANDDDDDYKHPFQQTMSRRFLLNRHKVTRDPLDPRVWHVLCMRPESPPIRLWTRKLKNRPPPAVIVIEPCPDGDQECTSSYATIFTVCDEASFDPWFAPTGERCAKALLKKLEANAKATCPDQSRNGLDALRSLRSKEVDDWLDEIDRMHPTRKETSPPQ